MSNLPEATENYAEATISNLDSAKKALVSGLEGEAFVRSFWCCENLLKAVLTKATKFDSERGGDKHHHSWKLYEKIKSHHLVDSEKIPLIENVLIDLLTINISSGQMHVDTAHNGRSRVGDLRYIDLNKYVSLNDAQEKVILADKLVSLLSGFF